MNVRPDLGESAALSDFLRSQPVRLQHHANVPPELLLERLTELLGPADVVQI
ncbi:hypothetical protein LCGC14_2212330, partial [marine sediment metagenome]